MTAADPPPSRSEREKLAETVKSAIVAHVPDGYDQVDIGWSGPLARECLEALAVLAQPRQECEALRAQGRGEVTAPSSQPDARTARERIENDWKTAFEMMRRSAGVLNADHPLVVMDDLFDALLAQVERLEKVVACDHPEEDWQYVEHEGKTWNECGGCGLMELWEGGMRVRQDFRVLLAAREEEAT